MLYCILILLKNYKMCLIFVLKQFFVFCCRIFQRKFGNLRCNFFIRQNKVKFLEKLRLKGLYCLLCIRNYVLCFCIVIKLVRCFCVICIGIKYFFILVNFVFIMNCSICRLFYKYFYFNVCICLEWFFEIVIEFFFMIINYFLGKSGYLLSKI